MKGRVGVPPTDTLAPCSFGFCFFLFLLFCEKDGSPKGKGRRPANTLPSLNSFCFLLFAFPRKGLARVTFFIAFPVWAEKRVLSFSQYFSQSHSGMAPFSGYFPSKLTRKVRNALFLLFSAKVNLKRVLPALERLS